MVFKKKKQQKGYKVHIKTNHKKYSVVLKSSIKKLFLFNSSLSYGTS